MSEERTATGLGFPTVGNAREFAESKGMLSIKKLMEEEVKFAKILLEDKGFDKKRLYRLKTTFSKR